MMTPLALIDWHAIIAYRMATGREENVVHAIAITMASCLLVGDGDDDGLASCLVGYGLWSSSS